MNKYAALAEVPRVRWKTIRLELVLALHYTIAEYASLIPSLLCFTNHTDVRGGHQVGHP